MRADALTQITDHVSRALHRLLSQFQGKPRWEALIASYVTQVQQLENEIWLLHTMCWIDSGEGQQLDDIGDVVGEARQGWSDDEYRGYLKARIRTSKSDGKIETLVRIVRLIYGLQGEPDPAFSLRFVKLREYYPAALEIETWFNAATIASEYINRGFLQRAKPDGVSLHYIARHQSTATTLLFDDYNGGFVATQNQRPGDGPVGSLVGGRTASVYGATP